MSRLHPLLPSTAAVRCAWLWCLVAMLVLKAAVPLLAAVAADRRGVPLAQVCTVYGVRTAAAAGVAAVHAGHPDPSHPADSQGETLPSHGGGEHCALAALAGGPLPAAVPSVLAHAPPQVALATQRVAAPLPADAVLRWLSARLHAPPVSTLRA